MMLKADFKMPALETLCSFLLPLGLWLRRGELKRHEMQNRLTSRKLIHLLPRGGFQHHLKQGSPSSSSVTLHLENAIADNAAARWPWRTRC